MAKVSAKKKIEASISAYDYTKDIRSYLKSSLFNSYYLEKGFVSKFKESWIPHTPAWEHFYNGIIDFIESKDESFFLNSKPSESLTVDSYIMPVMALLGWDKFGIYNHYDTETTYDYDGKAYRPDLVYFDNPKDQQKVQALKGKIKSSSGKKKKEYQSQLRSHVEKKHNILVEAKMFGLLKNNSKRKDEVKKDSTNGKTPEGQTVTYMEMLRAERAILTDGGIWKFFHNEFRSEDKYVSFDFGKLALWLIKKINLEGFERGDQSFKKDENEFDFLLALFYNLFSKEAVLGEKIEHLVDNTRKYSEHLEDKIKNRFVMAVTHACNGLAKAVKLNGENPDEFLELIKKTAESHLFNIIFFRSLESRGVLPYYGEDNSYDKLSISKTIDSIYENGFNPSQSFKSQLNMFEDYYQERVDSKTSTICNNLIKLYRAVHKGISNGIHIEGFKESVFTEEEWEFANKYRIPDEYMLNVIFYLNLVPKDRELGEYQLIPYDFLTPRELGSIFESFLEFKIEKAGSSMFWDHKRKQWLHNPKVESIVKGEIIKKNEYFFSPDNHERKMTGAYYTPDYIVRYIVERSIGDFCKNKKPDEILEIRICDPAMGSGHFLKGALDYITEQYIESHLIHNLKFEMEHIEVMQKVLESCIYGVDINESAVKLAKMSMWLCTANTNSKLKKLDKKFLQGNSLIDDDFKWSNRFKSIFKKGGFDVIVGNPPYVYTRSLGEQKDRLENANYICAEYQPDLYIYFLERAYELVVPEGIVSLIVPNSFLHYKTMVNLRSFLIKNNSLREITKAYDAFDGVTVDPVVLVGSRSKNKYSEIVINSYPRTGTLFNVKKLSLDNLSNDLFINLSEELYDEGMANMLEKASSKKIGDRYKVTMGIKMRSEFIYKSKKNKYSKPLLKGKNIFPYSVLWDDDQYIEYSKKAEGSYSNQALRDEKIFKSEKVVIRQTADNFYATYDSQEFYAMQSTYCITGKNKETTIDLKYLTCYLNSKIVKDYYSLKFKKDKTTFPQIRGYDVKEMPLVEADIITRKKVSKLYDKLSSKASINPSMSILEDPIQLEIDEIFEELIKEERKSKEVA